MADFLRSKCHLVLLHRRNDTWIMLHPLGIEKHYEQRIWSIGGESHCGCTLAYTFSILYPMPICVWIYCGESGLDSSFLRSVAIKTRREATSLSQELPQTSWVI